MNVKKHLFIGFGSLAHRCAEKLIAKGEQVTAIARSKKPFPSGMTFWQGDIQSDDIQQRLQSHTFDSAIITLTPDGRDAESYRSSYYDNVAALVNVWKAHQAPKRVIFTSSTRVYGQNNGEWVNEQSSTCPQDKQGAILLETEKLLLESHIVTCLLRFSGIYGPGRDFLIQQVRKGMCGNQSYTNRIHEQDCCGVILHILQNYALETPPPIVLASDCEPVTSHEIRAWLAEQLGVTLNANEEKIITSSSELTEMHQLATKPVEMKQVEGKRCNNQLLLKTGYVFRFPNYISGYSSFIHDGKSTENKN